MTACTQHSKQNKIKQITTKSEFIKQMNGFNFLWK